MRSRRVFPITDRSELRPPHHLAAPATTPNPLGPPRSWRPLYFRKVARQRHRQLTGNSQGLAVDLVRRRGPGLDPNLLGPPRGWRRLCLEQRGAFSVTANLLGSPGGWSSTCFDDEVPASTPIHWDLPGVGGIFFSAKRRIRRHRQLTGISQGLAVDLFRRGGFSLNPNLLGFPRGWRRLCFGKAARSAPLPTYWDLPGVGALVRSSRVP